MKLVWFDRQSLALMTERLGCAMRSVALWVGGFFCACSLAGQEVRTSPVDLVNPLVGTLSSFEISTGNTYPVISRPWGMNSWTPQTGKMGDGWQYTYTAGKIRGIKQTHQPSPWINDYGQFSIMPTVGKSPIFDEDERASWFSHKAERATPYSYEVYLADYDTRLRFAPSERAAVFGVRFPKHTPAEERWIVVDAFDAGGEVRQLDRYRLVGISRKNSGGVPKNFGCYFVVEFEEPIKLIKKQRNLGKGGRHELIAVSLEQKDIDTDGETYFRVASSFVSPKQALKNLSEVAGKSLDEVSGEGHKVWTDLMSRIDVEDDRPEKATFYSNLYRCLLFPRRFYEEDERGQIIHYSPYSGKVEGGYMYTDTGVWDTFRALFPLINLVYPEEGAKMQEGMLNAYRESGFFPEWASPGHRDCMVGNNSASVVVDAYLKGIGPADTTTLLSGLRKSAHAVHPSIKSTGRLGHEYYNRLGYVPTDVGIKESAARSLEYAYADWCIYQTLKHSGASQAEQEVYKARSLNYKNLFDSSTGWMRGREQSGQWQTPFSPYKWGDAFTEGNALHYTWSVFHDVAGLIDLMGGQEAFVSRLDTIFSMPPIFDNSYYGFTIHEIREMQIMDMGNYAHGNQPIQHMLYLYSYAGAPYKAQRRIREVMNKLYSNAPDGYCGDEDNGQTSAWYVFSALGFYPVQPTSGEYIVGVPYFSRVRLRLPAGEVLIDAKNALDPYIQTMRINGVEEDRTFLRYDELKVGAKIEFVLGKEPSKWGVNPTAYPYSLSREGK